MKKVLVVLLHIGFWGCYFILTMVILGVLYGREGNVDESQIENAFRIIFFFALIPSFITFYSFYFLLFPKFLLQKKFTQAAVYGILISLAAGLIGYTILNAMFGSDCFGEEPEGSEAGIVFFIAFVAMISGVIAWVIQGFITWFEEIKLKETLRQKNQEMELALVKAQLDPHFLFNTINNIDVLILKNAERASNYLNKLSDIMRFMLYETKTDTIPLSKEIEYIQKYIELQKIRTSNESYVNFGVSGTSNGNTIAPMIFIPFIENAFKHNNNKKLENAIKIHIDIAPSNIKLECANKFDPDRKMKQENNGLGIDLIKRRLNLIYPDRHTLEINHQNDLYQVNLTIHHA